MGGNAATVFRGMATLAMGTGMARLIGVATIPILTRIYSPADYGVLAVYTALVAIVAPTLSLRYVLAVPLPRSDGLALNLLALSAALMAATSLVAALACWLFAGTFLRWMSMEVLIPWWWLVLLGGLAVALYESMSLWATRHRAYKVIAQTKVVQSALGESVKLGLGLLALKPFGLLFGSLVEQSGGVSFLVSRFKNGFAKHAKRIRLKRMFSLISGYRNFPLFRLPSQFLLVFSAQAPAMFAAALYGAETTGQLGLALMALAVPSNLIGQSIGQAFYGEIARLKKGSELKIKELAYSVQVRLFVVGVPVSAIIFFFGESIFELAFGATWKDAGRYAAILSPYVLLQLTSSPLVQILNIYNSQLSFLLINTFRAIGLGLIYSYCENSNSKPDQFISLLGFFLFFFYLLVSLYILRVVTKAASNRAHQT